MDTSDDKMPLSTTVATTVLDTLATSMDAELSKAIDEQPVIVHPPPDAASAMTDEKQTPPKGKKNARFGRNPDGTPAKKADKKEVERKSPWGRFLHQYKLDHPELHSLEATIEARKVYTPQSGKQKSFERIFTEVWKTKNPRWASFSKEQRIAAIRADFIKLV